MALDLGFLILLLLMVLYLIFIEIFTVIFMITGMSRTRSIFQVISMLTNSGFTTSESEIIVSSRKRRKIAIIIMMFGNMFNVAIVSLVVNALLSISKDGEFSVLSAILYLMIFLIFLILVKTLPFIRVAFDRKVKKIANKVMFNQKSNFLLILDNFNGYVIVEVKLVEVPEIFVNKTLIESSISKEYGIRVLIIKRGDKTIGDITKDEVLLEHDRVTVFGPLDHIIKVFKQKPSHY